VARKPKAKAKAKSETNTESNLVTEVGRIAKLFALFLVRDVSDELEKVRRLSGVGFATQEIADMLGKTEHNVRVQVANARKKSKK
jgi:DNA-binding NarL/FixJ family response regulator